MMEETLEIMERFDFVSTGVHPGLAPRVFENVPFFPYVISSDFHKPFPDIASEANTQGAGFNA
jgi:hypothetical protein